MVAHRSCPPDPVVSAQLKRRGRGCQPHHLSATAQLQVVRASVQVPPNPRRIRRVRFAPISSYCRRCRQRFKTRLAYKCAGWKLNQREQAFTAATRSEHMVKDVRSDHQRQSRKVATCAPLANEKRTLRAKQGCIRQGGLWHKVVNKSQSRDY
jgi:hypothetical protein